MVVNTWSLYTAFIRNGRELVQRQRSWLDSRGGVQNGMLAVSPMNQVGSPAVYNFGPHIVSPEFIYLFFSGKSLHVLNMC